MDSNDSFMCGQLLTSLQLSELEGVLAGAGYPSAVRESAHHVGGHYLSVSSRGDEATCSFERTGEHEYIVRGDAGSVEALTQLSATLSRTLANQSVKHRLEIYDAAEALHAYLHFDWPRDEFGRK